VPILAPTFPQLPLFRRANGVIGQEPGAHNCYHQVPSDLDLELAQPFDLGPRARSIDHDAVADYANFSAPQNSRTESGGEHIRAAMNNGVTRVVAALAADHDVRLGGQDIDVLSLALIAPLAPIRIVFAMN